MKLNLIFLLLLLSVTTGFSQIRVPKNFYLVKGASPVGRDDYYTDGQFQLSEDTPFQGGRPASDYGILTLLHQLYGIEFNKTRKDYYTGTGYSSHKFKTIVVVKGFAYLLTSNVNNVGYQNYSKWLIGQMVFHWSEGDRLYFKK